MSPAHADLTGLLRAELGTEEVTATGEHLRGCHVCRDDLAETAVGHALLARSARTLGSDATAATGTPPSVADLEAAFPDEHPPRRRLRLLAAAAALVVAASVGAGAQAMIARDQSPSPSGPPPSRRSLGRAAARSRCSRRPAGPA